jgi:hypothetical protein
MPSFRLKLANTYWKKGFFNVVGRVTRSANQNATPRIAGNKAMAEFFQAQFKPGDSVQIEFLSPTAIRVGGHGPA